MLNGEDPSADSKRSKGPLFACKVVSLINKSSRQIGEMEREVEILSRLNHPNIIRLHCTLRTLNNLYLFTDYCDRGDLKLFMQSYCTAGSDNQSKQKDS
jgi:serine/threonine protein kinase